MVRPDVLESPAAELVFRLESAGVRFRLDGEHLRLAPREAVTPDVVAALRAHKDDVTTLLQLRDSGVVARRAVFEAALSTFPTGALVLNARVPWRVGTCFSCGDPTTQGLRPIRCWRCLLACRLALGVALPCGGVQ